MSTPWLGMCDTVVFAGCAASKGGSEKIAAGTDCAFATTGAPKTTARTTTVQRIILAVAQLRSDNIRGNSISKNPPKAHASPVTVGTQPPDTSRTYFL
jgi:hypothetical protein